MGVGAHHPVQGAVLSPASPEEKGEKDGKEGEENAGFRAWVVGVVQAIGGSEWKRSGTSGVVISIGVPCRDVEGIDIGPKGDQETYEPFFQVDLQLCPAKCVEFTLFIRSYSNTLLSHAVNYISPHLSLLNTHLGLRYSPYFGLEPIRMEITSSPEELCEWLGVDYAKMQRGLETEKDLWKWATEVREGGAVDGAWKMVANRRKKGGNSAPGRKGKDEGWARFVQWLRTDKESPYNIESAIPAGPSDSTHQDMNTQGFIAPTPTQTADDANPSHEPILEGETVTVVPTLPQIKVNENYVDPEKPKPLHYKARSVVDRFGKMDEWSELLKERKTAAVLLANRQRLKVETPSVLASDASKVFQNRSVERMIAETLDELEEHLRGMEVGSK